VRKKRSSRTNLDADGSITAFAEAALAANTVPPQHGELYQAALAAGANDAAAAGPTDPNDAAAAADDSDSDSGPPCATGSPKQSALRSPRPASDSQMN
jgi:hypothetical protein